MTFKEVDKQTFEKAIEGYDEKEVINIVKFNETLYYKNNKMIAKRWFMPNADGVTFSYLYHVVAE